MFVYVCVCGICVSPTLFSYSASWFPIPCLPPCRDVGETDKYQIKDNKQRTTTTTTDSIQKS